FEQALRLRPDLPAPHRNLGDLAGISGNYLLAIQHYREALALDPDNVRTLTSLGSASADALNRGEAVTAFQKAIALITRNPALKSQYGAETYQRNGLALFKLRDLTGARQALEQAEALGPLDPDTHLFLGLVLAQQPRGPEDEQKALEHLDKSAQLGY